MNSMSSTLAIITARGGSKRIPRKNIRPFRGRPMLAWAVEAALSADIFDTVMVSTDDQEIAELAISFGAQVPFMRSSENADDFSTTSDVLSEVLARYSALGTHFDHSCCIYPTAPFIQSTDLIDGYQMMLSGEFDVVMPVAEFSYPIWRSLNRDDNKRVALNFPENLNKRSQDLPPSYHDAGQWYWFRTQEFLNSGTLLGENTGSVVLRAMQVQDIDTDEDWALAEVKHKTLFSGSV